MSYLRKLYYKVVPEESYKVIRNCAGCGSKAHYQNTFCFRVNANGNRVDVWLIYQCEKCKHTCNLSVYERVNPENIPEEEYRMFLENNRELAKAYGIDKSFFTKNRAEVDIKNVNYRIETEEKEDIKLQTNDLLVIQNPENLKIRVDKLIADIFHITRSQAKKLEQSGKINIQQDKMQHTYSILLKESLDCQI